MTIHETEFQGLVEIYPNIHKDNRGYFAELFKQSKLATVTEESFVQDNYSFSKAGVLRAFHFQRAPFEQCKLVLVLAGKVLDIVVDMRRGSSTFGQHFKCLLDGTKMNMLLVPSGFAHGFLALQDSHFFYKCSAPYNPEADAGFIWNDPSLNIDWPEADYILSEKDQGLPDFETAVGHS